MKKKFWIVNKVNASTVEILLYGFIGEYEAIDDAAFISDLRALENMYTTINIRVNCGGGDVYKGLAIFNAIQNSRADIAGFIDGIAASMGAVIILACKKRYMSQYARYMTHRVNGGMYGNADDLRDYADHMETMEGTIAKILAKQTGLSEADAMAKYITAKDRWISATQAVDEKLIDGIYDADPVTLPDNQADPQQLYQAYHKLYNISQPKKNEMKLVAKFLGLPEDASEADVLAKVTALRQEKEAAEGTIKSEATARAKSLVDTAISNKQLVEADREVFQRLAETNYNAAAATIAKIPAAKKPGDLLNRGNGKVNGEGEDTGDIDTWEKLVGKGDAFVAQFKKDNEVEYSRLLNEYRSKPVETK